MRCAGVERPEMGVKTSLTQLEAEKLPFVEGQDIVGSSKEKLSSKLIRRSIVTRWK